MDFTGNRKGKTVIKAVFCVLVVVFVLLISVIMFPAFERYLNLPFLIIFGTGFFLLGIVLIFLTLRQEITGCAKHFLILTGASSAGFVLSIIFHNLIYGLFILWLGIDFWKRFGSDEALFFLFAIFVCPAGFLTGVIGSIILFIKKRTRR